MITTICIMSGSGKTFGAEEVQAKIDGDLIGRAEESGIDVTSVVESTIEEYSSYSIPTVVRFAESALNNKLEASSAEKVAGILCGSRDRFGKNWPRRHALVRSNGEHIEASTWSGSIQTAEGGEVQIPAGSAVEVRLEHDAEYDSYDLKQLDSATELPRHQLASKLSDVAKHPSEIGRNDEYTTVAVRGEVRYINPQTVFEDGEPKGDGPIMMPDERGNPKPHFELVLSEAGDTRLRAHVERQRYGEPFFSVEDFEALCRDAHANFDTPDGQTNFIGDAMRGREVIVIGNINKVNKSRNDGDVTKYIDVGVAGIVEVPEDAPDEDHGSVSDTEPEPEQEPEQGGEESVSDDGKLGDFQDPADEVEDDEPEQSGDSASVDEITETIEQYINIVGMDASELSVEVVEENTAIDAPGSVISAAIERLSGDSEAPQTHTGGDSGEEGDLIERLRNSDTGQLECPHDGCYYNCGSEAEMYGHVASTHIAGDDNPEEWLEQEA